MTYKKFKSNFSLAFFTIILAILPSFANAEEIHLEGISQIIKHHIKTAVNEYFKTDLEENFQIKPLTGGYSATSIRIDFANKSYVLRIISESESSCRVSSEIYAMQNAAEAGIAPPIHWISADGRAILMDYIPGETLSIEYSKNPKVIENIADLLRKVHGLPKNLFNAPSFKEHTENFYLEHSKGSDKLDVWDAAISIIRQGSLELEKLGSPSVNNHGDLNPRNILVTPQTLYFIDWSEGMYTEPFLDLGFFSILMDYNAHEDDLLLKKYLLRNPTPNEKKRFAIAKKMNFGRLALRALSIGNKLYLESPKTSSSPCELKEWSFYARAFANNDNSLSFQFFWDISIVALKAANSVDINDVD